MQLRLSLSVLALTVALTGTAWAQPSYNPTLSDFLTGNTAGGTGALFSNSGINNTAFGRFALGLNTLGTGNTAFGSGALRANLGGRRNVAVGQGTLRFNIHGTDNVAVGGAALRNNIDGDGNIALGGGSLFLNTTGNGNIALGGGSMFFNVSGEQNIALGGAALQSLTTGFGNVSIGSSSGNALQTGDFNIYLGSGGAAIESNTIRIGQPTFHTRAFLTGVTGVPVTGAPVHIAADGQLGILASSARYKQDIEEIGERSANIEKLQPVTYRYTHDETHTRQYGLIAEDVATIYPELVVKDAHGQIMTVNYTALIPMLVNEVQRQQRAITALTTRLEQIEAVTRVRGVIAATARE